MSVTVFLRAAIVAAAVVGLSGPTLAMGSGGSDDAAGGQEASAYDRGAAAAEGGRYREAIGLLQEAVHADPTNADAYNYLGFSHRKLGEFDPARTYYMKALDIDPTHVDAMEYLGELYVQTGNLEAAETVLDRIAAQCGRTCEQYQVLDQSIVDAQSN